MAVGPYVREQSLRLFVKDLVRLYYHNFRPIFVICAAFFVPYWVLLDMSPLWFAGYLQSGIAQLWFGGALIVSSMLVNVMAAAVLVVTVHDICVGNRPSVRLSFRRTARYLGPLLVVALMEVVLFGLGFVLFLIPALVLAVYFLFSTSAVVVEQQKGAAALRRSAAIVRGSFWRISGYLLVIYLIMGIFGAIINGVLTIALPYPFEELSLRGMLLVDIINNMILALIAPLAAISVVLLYYDLRSRKENIDIEEIELAPPVRADDFGIHVVPSPVVASNLEEDMP